jgi:hypothetical protein
MRPLLLLVAVLTFVGGTARPALADQRSEAKAQVEFGIEVAQRNLWKEATYENALELEPSNTFMVNNYALFREIYDRQNRRRDR